MSKPRVSILIPNFNNGKESTINCQHDLIGNLMDSLYDTLKNDPTPFEIIAFDDGSTDDSLETLKQWTKKTWNNGQPVLNQLIEGEHCGVLSVTANKLVEASSGEYLVRLDGDVVLATNNWVSKLCQIFDTGPADLGAIGPKQLGTDGLLHSFGDWLLHPKGYHHIGSGLDRFTFKRPLEVDHVMGCCYCCKREVHDDLGGYDERILRGQTVDFGMRARLNGWRCWAVPQIEFQHCHSLRTPRETRADQVEGVSFTLDLFRKKWGFDRIAPDLEYVRKHYANTPLLWNASVFGVDADTLMREPLLEPVTIESSDWGQYSNSQHLQQIHEGKLQIAQAVLNTMGEGIDRSKVRFGVIGNGAGVFGHIMASNGINYAGVDTNPDKVNLSIQCTQSRTYDNAPNPAYVYQENWRHIPLEDGSLDVVMLLNVLENHANPVTLLDEVHRVLGDGENKLLLIGVTRQPERTALLSEPLGLYTNKELMTQVHASRGWMMLSPGEEKADEPVIALFKRIEKRHTEIDDEPEMVKIAKKIAKKQAILEPANC